MHTRLYSIFLLLLIPSLASALGLGKLQLNSALNEPFDARIRLLSPTAAELDSLEVRLADSAAFARVNIDRPAVLSRLRFRLDRAERGADTLHITSAEPIREPFLRFLIEINWSNGRLFREYTVLLDPPLYDPEKRISEFSPATTRAAPRPGPRAAASGNPDSGRTYYSGGDYGPIRATDTLWSIANATRPSASISVNQMMLALLRANPDAFITENINGLKSGHTLRMPSERELNAAGGDAEILAEVRAQHAAWQAARERAAAVAGERPEPALMAADLPSLPASAPAAPGSELRLVSLNNGDGGNPGGGAAADGQALILAQESIESLKRENLELTDRLTENRNLIEDLQRLLSLKDSEMAALQAQLGRAEAMAAEQREAMAGVKSEGAEGADAGALNAYSGALKNILAAWPLIAMVGAGLLLLLLILFLLRLRKGGEAETDILAAGPAARGAGAAADAGQETGPPVPAKALTGNEARAPRQKTGPQTPKATGVVVEEEPEEDPSREVNTYLAFEQFEQAEQIARDAIAAQPDNPEFHIKLLEVFYTSGNSGAYEKAARALYGLTGGKGEHWATATAMWSEMSPERALFSRAPAAAEIDAVADSDVVAGADEITERDAVTGVDAVRAEDETAGADAQTDLTADLDEVAGLDAVTETDKVTGAEAVSTEDDITGADTETDLTADLDAVAGLDEVTETDRAAGAEAVSTEDDITGADAAVQEGEATATDEELQDITDVTPVGALAIDSGPAEEADQSAETSAREAARARTEAALLDFDPAALTLETEEITAQPVPEPEAAAGAAEISLEPATVAEADMELDLDLSEFQLETDPADKKTDVEMELDLSELQLEADPADQKADLDMELDLSEFDLESAPAAAPDSGADTDFDLSELDNTPSHITDATPHAQSRPEDMSAEDAAAPASATGAGAEQLAVDDDDELETILIPRADQPREQSPEDQIATQLDLARAYIEIGDKQSARGILDEVMARGNADQKQQAEALSGQI